MSCDAQAVDFSKEGRLDYQPCGIALGEDVLQIIHLVPGIDGNHAGAQFVDSVAGITPFRPIRHPEGDMIARPHPSVEKLLHCGPEGTKIARALAD